MKLNHLLLFQIGGYKMKKVWNRNALIELLREHADEELAGPMSAYMRNQFPFLGIKSPLRKQLLKKMFMEYEIPVGKELLDETAAIYSLLEREFQYVAIALLDKGKKQLGFSQLTFCEKLITEKSWWDSVDSIAPSIVGRIVLTDRDAGEEVMRQWSASPNMWLNRSAILHQLKYKTNMNEEFLYSIIQTHIGSSEFFIQKAIGWVLREYAKTNPDSVLSFVNSTNLKPLSRREALKHLI